MYIMYIHIHNVRTYIVDCNHCSCVWRCAESHHACPVSVVKIMTEVFEMLTHVTCMYVLTTAEDPAISIHILETVTYVRTCAYYNMYVHTFVHIVYS